MWHQLPVYWTEIKIELRELIETLKCKATIELYWVEEYRGVNPPRLWETKVMGEKQEGSLLFLHAAFWLAQKYVLLYSGKALWKLPVVILVLFTHITDTR